MAKALRIIFMAILLTLAGTTLIYAVTKTLDATGGIDFHSYWYSGHFLRQGTDPFQAYLHGLIPKPAVRYLDHPTYPTGAIAQPGLATVPANTAPVVIALSTLAYFTWPTAKLIWLVINLALMIVIPGLVIRLLPKEQKLDTYTKALIYMAFIGMFGTRNIAGNGQTSLLIFALMLLALSSMRRSWLAAGAWLGLALSKYSLSLPVFIYFLIKKQYRAAITALVVQALAATLLGLMTRTSPLVIVSEYIQILGVHTNLPGIHLANLFPDRQVAGMAMTVALTAIVFTVLFIWLRRFSSRLIPESWLEQFSGDHMLTALVLWTLLVAYHRAYDSFVTILFFALVIYGVSWGASWRISPNQRLALAAGSVLAYILLSLPARGITFLTRALPDESLLLWLDFQGALLTLTLLALLAATLWLLNRINPNELYNNTQV